MHKKLLASIIFLLFSALLFAQREPDKIYMPNINGVKLFVRGNQMSYPIINVSSLNALELDFDDLEGNIKNYSYTYQLCNSDWTAANLGQFDYLKGFTQQRITKYRFSAIAHIRYTHYEVVLPDQ